MWSDRWSLRVTGSLSDGRRQELEGASLQGFPGHPARERRPLAATSPHHKHRWDLRDDLQATIHAANPLLIPRIRASPSPHRCRETLFSLVVVVTSNIARARIRTLRVPRAPRLVDVGRIPCPVVDRRRACPEHEAAVRACVATRAAVARGEEQYRLRTPTSRSAPGLSGRLAIPMPAMRTHLPGSRVHRGHLATAGRDGVRGVCHGAAAVNLLPRARRRGADAVVGERPRLAPGPGARPKHRPARRSVRSPRLA